MSTFTESLLKPVRNLAVGPTVRVDRSSVLVMPPKGFGLSIDARDHSGMKIVAKREPRIVENDHHH